MKHVSKRIQDQNRDDFAAQREQLVVAFVNNDASELDTEMFFYLNALRAISDSDCSPVLDRRSHRLRLDAARKLSRLRQALYSYCDGHFEQGWYSTTINPDFDDGRVDCLHRWMARWWLALSEEEGVQVYREDYDCF